MITPKLDVSLPTANLQPVLPGTTTEPLNINGISNVNGKVSLQLEDPQQSGIRLIPSDRTIELVANQATVIPVRLQIPAEAKGGASSLRLVLTIICPPRPKPLTTSAINCRRSLPFNF